MIYKPFQNTEMSTLGLGAMRLPTVGQKGPIDEEKARELIEYAYEHGVNYFDTAYRYHSGESEPFVGKVLEQYPRKTWRLASKMPGHMMEYRNGKVEFVGYLSGEKPMTIDGIFQDQLERCRVDYFDFYLLHNVCESSYGFYTDEELRVVEYLFKQKEAGRIRHLGFSAHGRAETIERFLDWNGNFEFAQIQLNYLDWTLQSAGKSYELLTKRGIPVIVMEPCRGGRLASLNAEANALLKRARPEDSIASWAFRYLQALDNVQVVLSGMSNMEQLKENIALFSKRDPVTQPERALLNEAVAAVGDMVPCTACRYCCDGCPSALDIPNLISLFNEMQFGNTARVKAELKEMDPEEMPEACIACGACVRVCPQGIDIPEVLRKFAQAARETGE